MTSYPDIQGHGRGSGYVFEKLTDDNPNSWNQVAVLVSSSHSGFFDVSWAINGDLLVVSDGLNSRAVDFYERDRINHGKWIVSGKLYASDITERDYHYGNFVAISGDQAVIV